MIESSMQQPTQTPQLAPIHSDGLSANTFGGTIDAEAEAVGGGGG